MRRLLVITAILLSSFTELFAQQKPDSSSHWNLSIGESVVSAYRKVEHSSPDDHLTKVDLSRFNAVSDAIRSLSGVQLKDYGGVGGLKTVNLRSLGSEHTGVYIDGIQVDNAQNMQVDLGRFSLDNVSYIDMYGGGKSSEIQSAKEYASSSSIYLNSLRPNLLSSDKTKVSVKLRAGSFGTFSPEATVEHLFKNSTSIRISSEYTAYDGKYKFHESKYLRMPDGNLAGYDTVMTRQNSDLRSLRLEGQLFSPSSSRTSWNVKAYLYDSNRGLPGPVIRRLEQTTADRQWDRNLFLQGKLQRAFGEDDRNVIAFSAKASLDYLRYKTFPEKDPYSMPYDNKYTQTNIYNSLSYMRKILPGLSVNEALDFQYSYLDANTRGFVFPSRYSLWAASALVWNPGKVDISASLVYMLACDKYSKPEATTLEAFSKENATRDSFTPTVKLVYRPSGNFSLSAFVKRSYRMPSFNDLYYTLIGNVTLRPETAWQSDLSLEDCFGLGQGWSVHPRGELYYNHVTDKIIAMPTSSQFRWSMYNIGNVHIVGADAKINVTKSFSNGLSGSILGKYSLQDARDYTSPESLVWKNQIPYVAKHSGSVTLDLTYQGYRMSYVQTYSSKRWSTGANLDDYLIKPWTTTDIFLSKEVVFADKRNLQIGLSLNNIFSEQYEFVQGYPMPGFNFIASVRVEL